MKVKRILLCLTGCFVLHIASLSALEMKDGRIKLVLHEDSGRFSLYYLYDVTKGQYTPLLVNQDPRTTSFSILFGTKVFRMGESSQFTQSVFQTSGSLGFEWKSSQFTVREEFSFIASGTSVLSDGISIKISITNLSESEKTVGVRYLLDTYLGEAKRTHFKTDLQPKISSEITLPANTISYIISQDLTAETSDGLEVMVKAAGATVPEKIVAANWKRLNDSSWVYDSTNGREFSQLPYSVNDSALLVYYTPETVPKGSTRDITILMGKATPAGFGVAKKADASLSSMFEKTITAEIPKSGSVEDVLRAEILNVDNFILQIDRKLGSAETITEEEIAVFKRILGELQKRKEQFGE